GDRSDADDHPDLGTQLGPDSGPQLETRHLSARPKGYVRRSPRFTKSWTASTIFSTVSPYFRRSSSASPLSPKTSCTPTIAMGTGWFTAIAAATAATALAVSGPSAGTRTVIRGIPRMSPMSSLIWCVAPSGPTVSPAWEQKIFTFRFV